jgi:hypothetical protein
MTTFGFRDLKARKASANILGQACRSLKILGRGQFQWPTSDVARNFCNSVSSLIGVKVRIWVALLLLILPVYAADFEVTALSFDAREFLEAFNSGAPKSRLVVILSPT